MTPSEYLDATKAKIGAQSDYELAQRLEIPRQRISAIRKGREPVDNYMAMKIAITLELDPASVIADIESQREKNEKRRAFWTGFLQRAAVVAALACTLAWSYSAGYGNAAGAAGGVALAAVAAGLLMYRSRRIICIM